MPQLNKDKETSKWTFHLSKILDDSIRVVMAGLFPVSVQETTCFLLTSCSECWFVRLQISEFFLSEFIIHHLNDLSYVLSKLICLKAIFLLDKATVIENGHLNIRVALLSFPSLTRSIAVSILSNTVLRFTLIFQASINDSINELQSLFIKWSDLWCGALLVALCWSMNHIRSRNNDTFLKL